MPVHLAPELRDLALDRLAGHGRPPSTSRDKVNDPGGARALRSAYPRSAPRFAFDLGENQGSVTIARTPASSMTTNSTPSAIGPWRSNQSGQRDRASAPARPRRVGDEDVRADQVAHDGQQEQHARRRAGPRRRGWRRPRVVWLGRSWRRPGLRLGPAPGLHLRWTESPLTPSFSPLGRGRPPDPSATAYPLGEGSNHPLLPVGEKVPEGRMRGLGVHCQDLFTTRRRPSRRRRSRSRPPPRGGTTGRSRARPTRGCRCRGPGCSAC